MEIFLFLLIVGVIISAIGIIEDQPFISYAGGIFIGMFIVALAVGPSFSTQNFCEENAICYELVETIAENTNYTEEDVAKFFAIVSDDMEAWDAIRMLDNSLTDEQINALMEISAMKQAE